MRRDSWALNKCAFRCRLNCPAGVICRNVDDSVPQARSRSSETSVPEAGARPWNNQCSVRRWTEMRTTMLGDESNVGRQVRWRVEESDWWTRHAVLNFTRLWTGSQWTWRNTGVMWSRRAAVCWWGVCGVSHRLDFTQQVLRHTLQCFILPH